MRIAECLVRRAKKSAQCAVLSAQCEGRKGRAEGSGLRERRGRGAEEQCAVPGKGGGNWCSVLGTQRGARAAPEVCGSGIRRSRGTGLKGYSRLKGYSDVLRT